MRIAALPNKGVSPSRQNRAIGVGTGEKVFVVRDRAIRKRIKAPGRRARPPCAGHPRLTIGGKKAWMAGPTPGHDGRYTSFFTFQKIGKP